MEDRSDAAHEAGLDESLLHLLKKVSRAAAGIYASTHHGDDMTQRQYVLLSCLTRNEGASQTLLVRETGIDRSTLAGMAARMEARGYIRRDVSPADRRARKLYLTGKGRRALQRLAPLMAEVDRRLLAALPASQRAVFLSALKRLAAHSFDEDGQDDRAGFGKPGNAGSLQPGLVHESTSHHAGSSH